MKRFNLSLIALLIGLSTLFSSCLRNEDDDQDQNQADTITTEDNENIEQTFEEVEESAREAGALDMGGRVEAISDVLNCAVITHNRITRTVVVDFGTGCTGPDGRTRRGKIIHVHAGRPQAVGSTVTTTFDNYYVNNAKVEGTIVNTFNGLNAQGNPSATIVVTNGKVSFPDGTFIQRNWTYTRTLVKKGPGQDEFVLTGRGNGVNRRGVAYTANITEPLVKKMSCMLTRNRYPVSGKLEIKPANRLKHVIDYGNGACDKEIKIIIGSQVITITLP